MNWRLCPYPKILYRIRYGKEKSTPHIIEDDVANFNYLKSGPEGRLQASLTQAKPRPKAGTMINFCIIMSTLRLPNNLDIAFFVNN